MKIKKITVFLSIIFAFWVTSPYTVMADTATESKATGFEITIVKGDYPPEPSDSTPPSLIITRYRALTSDNLPTTGTVDTCVWTFCGILVLLFVGIISIFSYIKMKKEEL